MEYFEWDNGGFLSNTINDLSKSVEEQHRDYFELANELNSFLYVLYEKDSFDVMGCNLINVFSVAAFFKTHKSFQSFIILYRLGLKEDALIIMRTMFEMIFIVGSINRNPETWKELLVNQQIEENKLRKIEEKREKKPLSFFANKSGLKKIYKAYIFLCKFVHFNFENLNEKIEYTYFRKVKHISVTPDFKDIEFFITETIGIMIEFVESISQYINWEENQKTFFNEIKKKHRLLQNDCKEKESKIKEP